MAHEEDFKRSSVAAATASDNTGSYKDDNILPQINYSELIGELSERENDACMLKTKEIDVGMLRQENQLAGENKKLQDPKNGVDPDPSIISRAGREL